MTRSFASANPETEWDHAQGGSYKAALRYVNGMSITTTNGLIATTADAALRKVCEWRRDTPGALAELMNEAGIVALDESRNQHVKRLLFDNWHSLARVAEALGVTIPIAKVVLHNFRKCNPTLRVERRSIVGEDAEYRAVRAA